MKKLMIAAAIVCAAAVSQAASVTWSSGDKAYGATTWASLADITVGTFAADEDYGEYMDKISGISWEFTGTLTKGTESEDIGGTITWSNHKAKGTFESELFVLPTDESTVDYSWEIQMVGTFKKGDQEYTITSDLLKDSGGYSKLSDYKIDTAGPTSWTVKTSAVPEPTSGLLLLLGVAGLALRRRRA